MEEIRNSYKTRQDNTPVVVKHIERSIDTPVIQKKPSFFRRIFNGAICNDVGSIKDSLIKDYIIPDIRNALYNMMTGLANMLFYGGSRGQGPTNVRYVGDRVSYKNYGSSFNNPQRQQPQQRVTQPDKDPYAYENIVVPRTYIDKNGREVPDPDAERKAWKIISDLCSYINEYGQATVLDLYQAAGMPSDYTDDNRGWKDLSKARVVRVREGYWLDLPKPIDID